MCWRSPPRSIQIYNPIPLTWNVWNSRHILLLAIFFIFSPATLGLLTEQPGHRSGGVMDLDLRLQKSRVRTSAVPLSGNNLGQVVHTRVSVAKQYNLVPVKGRWCPATGKVTVGLASHCPCVTDQWFIHLRANGLRKGAPHTPHGVWHSFLPRDAMHPRY